MFRHLFATRWRHAPALHGRRAGGDRSARSATSSRAIPARSASSSRPRSMPTELWRGRAAARARARRCSAISASGIRQHNNGVLIYVLLADRDVEILADRGIAARVPQAEWEQVCREIEAHYRDGPLRSRLGCRHPQRRARCSRALPGPGRGRRRAAQPARAALACSRDGYTSGD